MLKRLLNMIGLMPIREYSKLDSDYCKLSQDAMRLRELVQLQGQDIEGLHKLITKLENDNAELRVSNAALEIQLEEKIALNRRIEFLEQQVKDSSTSTFTHTIQKLRDDLQKAENRASEQSNKHFNTNLENTRLKSYIIKLEAATKEFETLQSVHAVIEKNISDFAEAYLEFVEALDNEARTRKQRRGPKAVAEARELLQQRREKLEAIIIALKHKLDFSDPIPGVAEQFAAEVERNADTPEEREE